MVAKSGAERAALPPDSGEAVRAEEAVEEPVEEEAEEAAGGAARAASGIDAPARKQTTAAAAQRLVRAEALGFRQHTVCPRSIVICGWDAARRA
ncbi:hypothetical protein Busp01_47470 [Trinickia caryophylli]|uniref:Uncharacterized protein n=1 Tax=Trinickia caryophylli TaxID=28094 RepID=A0A1X7GAJ6_TRICW|nr:hypothetical protein Busp01_47470 [Trinickia caryophylli]SMF66792.1 hypothetical protein SAMN06295900_114153 [Trinickia caryophylli]